MTSIKILKNKKKKLNKYLSELKKHSNNDKFIEEVEKELEFLDSEISDNECYNKKKIQPIKENFLLNAF